MTTELKKPGVPGDLSDVAARLSSSTELAEVSPKSLAKPGTIRQPRRAATYGPGAPPGPASPRLWDT